MVNSDSSGNPSAIPETRHADLYSEFLAFIHSENEKSRVDVNRRLRSVFVWCFLVPILLLAFIAFFVNVGILPKRVRAFQDWILLLFPVLYSLYFLSSQVLSGIPDAVRRGGFGLTLGQVAHEASWRLETCERMEKELRWSSNEWAWVISNAEEDLERMQMRLRHLTALAGAVFFLISQGIDSLTGDVGLTGRLVTGFGGANSSEWVGLALFLLLLYLSGQQNIQILRRFMGCAKLAQLRCSRDQREVAEG